MPPPAGPSGATRLLCVVVEDPDACREEAEDLRDPLFFCMPKEVREMDAVMLDRTPSVRVRGMLERGFGLGVGDTSQWPCSCGSLGTIFVVGSSRLSRWLMDKPFEQMGDAFSSWNGKREAVSGGGVCRIARLLDNML